MSSWYPSRSIMPLFPSAAGQQQRQQHDPHHPFHPFSLARQRLGLLRLIDYVLYFSPDTAHCPPGDQRLYRDRAIGGDDPDTHGDLRRHPPKRRAVRPCLAGSSAECASAIAVACAKDTLGNTTTNSFAAVKSHQIALRRTAILSTCATEDKHSSPA